MPIVVNKNTTQTPISTVGHTGQQSVKFIPAPRVYLQNPNSLFQAPYFAVASQGNTPYGWTDLGIVDGNAQVNYNHSTAEVATGLEGNLRTVVTTGKSAQITFSLQQFDDVVFEQITGELPNVVNSSVVSYGLGTQTLKQAALLLVVQNKLDGKEWQFYNPAALLNFNLTTGTDSMELQVVGYLPAFQVVGQTKEQLMSVTCFSPGAAAYQLGYGRSPFGTIWGQ